MTEQERLELQGLLGRRAFAELIAVIEGLKPAMRVRTRGRAAERLKGFCTVFGLEFEQSDYAVEDGVSSGGVFHTAAIVPWHPRDKGHQRFVYIGHDMLAVRLAKAFDGIDSRRFGLLQGYPECCIDFFCEYRSQSNFDLIRDVKPPAKGRYEPVLNYACRHFDYGLLSHFPCRWDCERSHELALARFRALDRYDHEIAMEMMNCMESDVLYSDHVVVALKDLRWSGNSIFLKDVKHWMVGIESADEVKFTVDGLELLLNQKVIAQIHSVVCLPFQSQDERMFSSRMG
jgi:hypothetical protein